MLLIISTTTQKEILKKHYLKSKTWSMTNTVKSLILSQQLLYLKRKTQKSIRKYYQWLRKLELNKIGQVQI